MAKSHPEAFPGDQPLSSETMCLMVAMEYAAVHERYGDQPIRHLRPNETLDLCSSNHGFFGLMFSGDALSHMDLGHYNQAYNRYNIYPEYVPPSVLVPFSGLVAATMADIQDAKRHAYDNREEETFVMLGVPQAIEEARRQDAVFSGLGIGKRIMEQCVDDRYDADDHSTFGLRISRDYNRFSDKRRYAYLEGRGLLKNGSVREPAIHVPFAVEPAEGEAFKPLSDGIDEDSLEEYVQPLIASMLKLRREEPHFDLESGDVVFTRYT